ncbi:MAG: DUF3147 family protein [Prosthecobacter sp.]|nr:DUF3147 family protein [Prosthecobacter sp.]
MTYLIIKALLSGLIITVVSELAKRNNTAASVVHSLPLMSLLAFVWLYSETKDAALIGRHAWGTFWFVLPTLPMFLLMPWLINRLGGFWPALATGIVLTVALYALTMRLLKVAGVNL